MKIEKVAVFGQAVLPIDCKRSPVLESSHHNRFSKSVVRTPILYLVQNYLKTTIT